ncbi:MAG: GntR family transcriptional regulator [Lachnospiraceae bacterium]|jgi:DNA-binding GntR family transcriptional regulator|nr:GntR family transcriptional regulator [Lachnospiraceae bacterium]
MASRKDSAYYAILNSIIDGTITTQQLILEQDCADTYGISKPAAREVLQRLCHENYLKSYPRKGYMVREITPDECIQSQQVRYQLEAYCIRLLIKNGDPDEIRALYACTESDDSPADPMHPYLTNNTLFHLRLARLTGNRYLEEALQTYLDHASRCVVIFHYPAATQKDYTNYHARILDAILQKDCETALACLCEDLMVDPRDV